ncbi:MAG: hypothetical protein ACP5MD_01925 [Verrucomicrobiia bacterium]
MMRSKFDVHCPTAAAHPDAVPVMEVVLALQRRQIHRLDWAVKNMFPLPHEIL